ncbi:MAG: EF-hand domain-containing protein [Pseudonocardiales bacterium]|nr:EF-hand domain-containing protein [Pseudonocardiales bacterium]MBV9031196.1 EF-hand domain-containing protein [Pseudonocardiales bacterium]
MSDAVKDRKFIVLFNWFDQGKDGYLTHEDFQRMAERFASVAQEEDQVNATAMRDAVENWWGLLLAAGDTDADGRLARPEFIEAMKSSVTSPGNFESAVLAIADALMSALDTNRDGLVESQEYAHMYSALGVSPEHGSDAFRRLDRDGDGAISHEEFRTAIREFYLSDDENAPGNWLIGPFGEPA